jgi:hypothetical protein
VYVIRISGFWSPVDCPGVPIPDPHGVAGRAGRIDDPARIGIPRENDDRGTCFHIHLFPKWNCPALHLLALTKEGLAPTKEGSLACPDEGRACPDGRRACHREGTVSARRGPRRAGFKTPPKTILACANYLHSGGHSHRSALVAMRRKFPTPCFLASFTPCPDEGRACPDNGIVTSHRTPATVLSNRHILELEFFVSLSKSAGYEFLIVTHLALRHSLPRRKRCALPGTFAATSAAPFSPCARKLPRRTGSASMTTTYPLVAEAPGAPPARALGREGFTPGVRPPIPWRKPRHQNRWLIAATSGNPTKIATPSEHREPRGTVPSLAAPPARALGRAGFTRGVRPPILWRKPRRKRFSPCAKANSFGFFGPLATRHSSLIAAFLTATLANSKFGSSRSKHSTSPISNRNKNSISENSGSPNRRISATPSRCSCAGSGIAWGSGGTGKIKVAGKMPGLRGSRTTTHDPWGAGRGSLAAGNGLPAATCSEVLLTFAFNSPTFRTIAEMCGGLGGLPWH